MRGITVGLHVRTQTGEDALNNPIYSSIVFVNENTRPLLSVMRTPPSTMLMWKLSINSFIVISHSSIVVFVRKDKPPSSVGCTLHKTVTGINRTVTHFSCIHKIAAVRHFLT